jgi:CheY-like chemotaxis protein
VYGPVPKVHADAARLAQVFINLLINAVQALDESKAASNRVEVRTSTTGEGWAVVEIRDTGYGIPPENMSRIFDPFFSTKPIGSGSGLGLSICHGIVSALGGRIEVESELGRGSSFRVVLPPDRTEPAISEPARDERPKHVRGRVLVIDDERLILTTIRRTLSSTHDVEVASSADVAMARIEHGEAFDLMLCDLMMPGMGGIELYEKMKTFAPAMVGRMAFLTGGAFTPRARAFLESSDVPWIEKPFEVRELSRFVDELVAKSRAR